MKWHRIWALLYKYWCLSYRSLDRIFDIFYWPVVGLLIWGFTSSYIKNFPNAGMVVNFFMGGAILFTFFWRAQTDIGTFILEDFWSRNLYNIFSTPLKPIELLVSISLIGIVRSIISFALLAFLASFIYSFDILNIGVYAILLFASNLMFFGWVVGIFVSALIFIFGLRIQVFAWSLGFLIEPFSCVYYPLDSLPQWMQIISKCLPTTYIFEGMRYAYLNNSLSLELLFKSYGITIILLFTSYFFFIYSLNQAKKIGVLVREE